MPKEPDKSTFNNDAVLPRSLYTLKKDPRANIRDMANAVFSDKFMIFLSLIIVPMILIPSSSSSTLRF